MKQRVKGGDLSLREADMLRKKSQDEAEEEEVKISTPKHFLVEGAPTPLARERRDEEKWPRP